MKFSVRFRPLRFCRNLLVGVGLVVFMPDEAMPEGGHGALGSPAQPTGLNAQISLDIASRPLADAIDAFGAATGIEVFYDASLAVGQHSTAVKGEYKPMDGLEVLLRGTGYRARSTGPDMVSILPPAQVEPSRFIASSSLRVYEPYFARIQTRVEEILCADDRWPRKDPVVFKFWISETGVITRADIVGPFAGSTEGHAAISKLRELGVGEPIPFGLPQPLIMAILPPLAGEIPGCPTSKKD